MKPASKDEVRARVLSLAELDWQAYADLQQRVFGEVLDTNGLPRTRLTPDVFRWKYAPPAGEGRVAVVEMAGRLIACNAMFPLDLRSGDELRRGWQSCDTATSPEARGRGCFRECLRALAADLEVGEIFFGYPNNNSSHGFAASGCDVVAEIPLRVRPVVIGAATQESMVSIARFGAEQDAFAERLCKRGQTALERSASYLNWRYVDHPFQAYQGLHFVTQGEVRGLLVLQRSVMRGHALMVVAEFLALDAQTARVMARHARHLARAQGCRALLALTSERIPGLLRMPRLFMSKPHQLMQKVIGGTGGGSTPMARWMVQTGDWDVF